MLVDMGLIMFDMHIAEALEFGLGESRRADMSWSRFQIEQLRVAIVVFTQIRPRHIHSHADMIKPLGKLPHHQTDRLLFQPSGRQVRLPLLDIGGSNDLKKLSRTMNDIPRT
ncbi:hypothetical protein BC443_10425 [Salinicola sp. MIT1003]|nr:hypothetical protein BC443_10425 [Salinicola sp. MIT1003]